MKRFYTLIGVTLLILTGCSRSLFKGSFEKATDNLNFPEGPVCFRGQLTFSNCYGGWVGTLRNGEVDTLLNRRDGLSKTNGCAYDEYGNLYLCDYGFGAILKSDITGRVDRFLSEDPNGNRFNRPNDIIISSKNVMYFSDPNSYNDTIRDGRIFCCDLESKELTCLLDGLQFPNGLTLSPDESLLYVGESVNKNILRYSFTDSKLDTLITLPGGKQDPDGMVCDSEGNLYVAYFGGGKIYVISPEGEILDSVETPGRRPSNVEFGNNSKKILYVTECETNAIYQIKTKNTGY